MFYCSFCTWKALWKSSPCCPWTSHTPFGHIPANPNHLFARGWDLMRSGCIQGSRTARGPQWLAQCSAISSAAEGISKGREQSCREPGMQLLPLHAWRCLAHIQLHLCTGNKLRFVYTRLYRHEQRDGVKVTVWSKSSVQQSWANHTS